MIGSQAVAAWVAQLAFWTLLVLGVSSGQFGPRRAGVLILLWAVGYLVLPHLSPFSGLFVTPYIATLDIVLVFMVFNGDVRLT
jgi:hypothetical protein